jgi:SM-20-related protein
MHAHPTILPLDFEMLRHRIKDVAETCRVSCRSRESSCCGGWRSKVRIQIEKDMCVSRCSTLTGSTANRSLHHGFSDLVHRTEEVRALDKVVRGEWKVRTEWPVIDLLTIDDFLDDAARVALLDELNRSAGDAATVSGGGEGRAVEALVRRTTRVAVPPETRAEVRRRLMERKGAIEKHFGVALGECEEPQFLRYQEGDFFVAHQDGNTPLIRDDTRHRKVSVIAFLSPRSGEPAPGAYGGGSLVFHGRYPEVDLRVAAPAAPGTLVAFRAETTHEVTPVTHGIRYTLVSWFR